MWIKNRIKTSDKIEESIWWCWKPVRVAWCGYHDGGGGAAAIRGVQGQMTDTEYWGQMRPPLQARLVLASENPLSFPLRLKPFPPKQKGNYLCDCKSWRMQGCSSVLQHECHHRRSVIDVSRPGAQYCSGPHSHQGLEETVDVSCTFQYRLSVWLTCFQEIWQIRGVNPDPKNAWELSAMGWKYRPRKKKN